MTVIFAVLLQIVISNIHMSLTQTVFKIMLMGKLQKIILHVCVNIVMYNYTTSIQVFHNIHILCAFLAVLINI